MQKILKLLNDLIEAEVNYDYNVASMYKKMLLEAMAQKRLELITLPDKVVIEPGATDLDAQFATGWNACIDWIKAKG